MIDGPACMAALAATWPAARVWQQDGWTLRDGAGGGKRVSAASADDTARAASLAGLMPKGALAMLRAEQSALDADLAALGYSILDPTLIYAAPVADLAQKPPHVSLFDIWPPLAIMREIWSEGGIGPARLAVMDRATGPKTGLIARAVGPRSGLRFLRYSQWYRHAARGRNCPRLSPPRGCADHAAWGPRTGRRARGPIGWRWQ